MKNKKKKYSAHLFTHKVIHGPKPRKHRKMKRRSFRMLIFVLILVLIIIQLNKISLLPSAIRISEMSVHNITTQIVSKALSDTLAQLQIKADELTNYYYNDSEELVYCGVNTMLVNNISLGVIERINLEISQNDIRKIYIPMGRFISEGLFSNYGPKIELKIIPSGVVGVKYDNSFTAVGINQVNYRVWLHVDVEMQVLFTSNSKKVTVTQDIILVDKIMNGKVPDNYVNVPSQEDMLNFVKPN